MEKEKEKQVQIPQKLFFKLCQYFLLDDYATSANHKFIQEELEQKVQRMVEHDLWTTSCVAKSEEERKEARMKYIKDRYGEQ